MLQILKKVRNGIYESCIFLIFLTTIISIESTAAIMKLKSIIFNVILRPSNAPTGNISFISPIPIASLPAINPPKNASNTKIPPPTNDP